MGPLPPSPTSSSLPNTAPPASHATALSLAAMASGYTDATTVAHARSHSGPASVAGASAPPSTPPSTPPSSGATPKWSVVVHAAASSAAALTARTTRRCMRMHAFYAPACGRSLRREDPGLAGRNRDLRPGHRRAGDELG